MPLERRLAENVTFLADISWVDQQGRRQIRQQIFDAAFDMIEKAEQLIVLDMFLFNNWQGPVKETHRALSEELTQALIAKQRSHPQIHVTVISDPLNVVYGGLLSDHFEQMKAVGVNVVLTHLDKLQDSNPLYSGLWRWLIRPWGNSEGNALPNPLGEGRVSVRSYLALANFKANHRKLIVTDKADQQLHALVMSANPHDGSSAHRNVALQFDGEAAVDVLRSEKALLDLSDASQVWQSWPEFIRTKLNVNDSTLTDAQLRAALDVNSIQVLSESKIRDSVLNSLGTARPNDRVDILMFYLSHRQLVTAIKAAHKRGVNVRVLLDVNKDAFGRQKKGVPNRPVAAELHKAGVAIRWCETQGEQCHGKMLIHNQNETSSLLLGSGNYTRRNLDDFNLETNVLYKAAVDDNVILEAQAYFDVQWLNGSVGQFSTAYETHENDSLWLQFKYRFMELSGLGTF